MKRNAKFELCFPLPRVHLGMPTGNSACGFLLFGEEKELKICFSLSSCWDRRNDQILERSCPYEELVQLFDPCSVDPVNERLRKSTGVFQQWTEDFWWPSSRIPGGRIVLHLKEKLKRLILDYESGLIRALTRTGEIQFAASLRQNSLLIRDEKHLIKWRSFHPAWEFLHSVYEQVGIPPAEYFDDGCFQPLPGDPGTLAWFSGNQLNLALSRTAAERTMPLLPFESVLEENRNFWHQYWETVPELNLPDEQLNRFFRLAL